MDILILLYIVVFSVPVGVLIGLIYNQSKLDKIPEDDTENRAYHKKVTAILGVCFAVTFIIAYFIAYFFWGITHK
ncbi:MAG: hypothetical protein IJZ61_02285 [Oscillospiraceae bacterium]|nr:hypothetical protein [Oscillospiraceae bacterium]